MPGIDLKYSKLNFIQLKPPEVVVVWVVVTPGVRSTVTTVSVIFSAASRLFLTKFIFKTHQVNLLLTFRHDLSVDYVYLVSISSYLQQLGVFLLFRT